MKAIDKSYEDKITSSVCYLLSAYCLLPSAF